MCEYFRTQISIRILCNRNVENKNMRALFRTFHSSCANMMNWVRPPPLPLPSPSPYSLPNASTQFVTSNHIHTNTSQKFHDDTHYGKLKVRSDAFMNTVEDCLQSSKNLCKYYINISKHASYMYLCTCNEKLNAKRMEFYCRETKIHFWLGIFSSFLRLLLFLLFCHIVIIFLRKWIEIFAQSIVIGTIFSSLPR